MPCCLSICCWTMLCFSSYALHQWHCDSWICQRGQDSRSDLTISKQQTDMWRRYWFLSRNSNYSNHHQSTTTMCLHIYHHLSSIILHWEFCKYVVITLKLLCAIIQTFFGTSFYFVKLLNSVCRTLTFGLWHMISWRDVVHLLCFDCFVFHQKAYPVRNTVEWY